MRLFKRSASGNQKGFTLIELLVVATILGILTTIGLVSYRVANQKSRNAKRQADLEQVRAALEIYRTDVGGYSTAGSWDAMLLDLVGYISNTGIADPVNKNQFIYTYTPDGTGRTYNVCACLEPDTGSGACGNPYCLNNP